VAEPAVGTPPDLVGVEVCAYSGRLPGPACRHTKRVLALRDHVPTERCPFHVTLDVDARTGLALVPACRAGRPSRPQSFLVLPDDLRLWLRDADWKAQAPRFAPGCDPAAAGRRSPAIRSPQPDQTVLVIAGLAPEKQEVPLEAVAGGIGASLSWFVDGEYLGTVGADERLWWAPRPGRHEIVVTDEVGLSARRRLEVRTAL
jgi:penicillin-binding protein 1C